MKSYLHRILAFFLVLSSLFYANVIFAQATNARYTLCEFIDKKLIAITYDDLGRAHEFTAAELGKRLDPVNKSTELPKEFWLISLKSGIALTDAYGRDDDVKKITGIKSRMSVSNKEREMLLDVFKKAAQMQFEKNKDADERFDLKREAVSPIKNFINFVDCLNTKTGR